MRAATSTLIPGLAGLGAAIAGGVVAVARLASRRHANRNGNAVPARREEIRVLALALLEERRLLCKIDRFEYTERRAALGFPPGDSTSRPSREAE